VLGGDFVFGGQDMHDFVAHSIVYAAVEVCHYIVAEFQSFLDASRTAVVRLLRTALVNCQLLTIYSLRYPILTLRRTSTTKPCTLLILCFIIQGTSPRNNFNNQILRAKFTDGLALFIPSSSTSRWEVEFFTSMPGPFPDLPRESLAFGSFHTERIARR
jgi:hypothetical protein